MDENDLTERKRIAARLIFARDDLATALERCDLAVARGRIAYRGAIGRALMEAIAVAYGRAFSESRGLWALPKRYTRLSSSEAQELHSKLLAFRNQAAAHTDTARHALILAVGQERVRTVPDMNRRFGLRRRDAPRVISAQAWRAVNDPDEIYFEWHELERIRAHCAAIGKVIASDLVGHLEVLREAQEVPEMEIDGVWELTEWLSSRPT